MSTTLKAYFLFGYLYPSSITDYTLITDTLVFTAGTFIVLGWAKNLFTEKAVAFRFVCAIINGLRLGNLTVRIFLDLFGRSETNGYLREISLYLCIFFESHISN